MAITTGSDAGRPRAAGTGRSPAANKAGGAPRAPRADGSWPPRWLTPVAPAALSAGEGSIVATFAEEQGRIHKDSVAGLTGEPLRLRPWQRHLLRHVYARDPQTGRRLHRVAMIGMARKNGKTALGATLGLYGLMMEGYGAEVYSCAADKDQARLVFGAAKAMVELNSELAAELTLYRDAIEHPTTGSVYRALSSEAYTKEGLSPTLTIYDELHAAPNPDLYNVMRLASGARPEPLMIILTTSGLLYDSLGQDTICSKLYQYGRQLISGEEVNREWLFAWWEASNPMAELTDVAQQREANPGYGDLLDAQEIMTAAIEASSPMGDANEYRTKRLNLWVAGHTAAIQPAEWTACADPDRVVADGEQVTLGFDSSFLKDSTALVGCTLSTPRHLFVVGAWERPPGADGWEVPIADVKDAIREAARRYDVRAVDADLYMGWKGEIQELLAERIPINSVPPSPQRMVPAWADFKQAIRDRSVTHDGSPALSRHMANAAEKRDRYGTRLDKSGEGPSHRMDLAMAALLAHNAATGLLTRRNSFRSS